MKQWGIFLTAAFVILTSFAQANEMRMSTAQNAFDFTFKSIDGAPLPLAQFKGKVLLVVNTASRCGFTPQYESLQALYDRYKDQGLVVLGVPSNNFGGQEPGTSSEIKEFTHSKFNVTFPLTTTNDVTGNTAHPFYKWAEKQDVGGFLNTVPSWNFHKYLIGRNGRLIMSFSSTTKPESEEIVSAIKNALDEKQ